MESGVISVYNYDKVNLAAFQQPFYVDEEQIDREIAHLQNRYTRWESGTVIREGDMALCSLRSGQKRFQNSRVKILVGSGLLDMELEQSLVGTGAGQTITIVLHQGKDKVAVEAAVLEVINKITEPLKDEMAQGLHIPGVETIQNYREYLIQQQRKERLEEIEYPAIQFVLKEVIRKSQLVLKQEDWNQVVLMEVEKFRVLSSKEGLELETMTAEDFEGKMPVGSYHEMLVNLQQCAWESLSEYLLGKYYAHQEGYQTTREEYDKYLADYMQFWHEDRTMAEKINPYEYFSFQQYANYFYGKVRAYVEANILI